VLLFYVNITEKTSFMDGIEIKNKYYGGKIMIKYPLYVTLDTNIFDANKLDFSKESTLGIWNDLSTNEQETVMSMLSGLRK